MSGVSGVAGGDRLRRFRSLTVAARCDAARCDTARCDTARGDAGSFFANRTGLQCRTLLVHDVPHRRLDRRRLIQPPCAAVTCPDGFVRVHQSIRPKSPRGIGLEIGHHLFGRIVGGDHGMDVIRPHVQSVQRPSTMGADLQYRRLHALPTGPVQGGGFAGKLGLL